MKYLKRKEGRKKILDKLRHYDPQQIYEFNSCTFIKMSRVKNRPENLNSDTTFKTKPPFSIEIIIHIHQESIDSLFYLSLFHWVVIHISSFLHCITSAAVFIEIITN